MSHNSIIILGIPVDNLSMDETIGQIFAMIETSGQERRPCYVATVNVDFLVNTLSWRSKKVRHPELLNILRRADLVTPDGMPLVWASRFLGTPLKERVTGADLVPRLAEASAKHGKSIFFLGGREDVGRQAAELLKERYPELKIAGVFSPYVHVDGESLITAQEEDREIIDRINRSGADILLIGFGNPKQEVWFDRNRNRLKVPVSVGIGGTYEFITGSVKRAPEWMCKSGVEWIYRITQDPKRLWKRYFVGFFKFGFMVFPAIAYYRYRRLLYHLFSKKPANYTKTAPEPGKTASAVNIITLPELMDAETVSGKGEKIKAQLGLSAITVFDLSRVTFMDSSGLGMLISLNRLAQRTETNIYFIGIRSHIRRVFELNRIYDLFKEKIYKNIDEVLKQIKKIGKLPPFYIMEVSRAKDVLIHLFGTLDASQMPGVQMETILKKIGERCCILNLRDLTFIDSSGLVFFLKIQRYVSKQGKACVLCGLKGNVRQMFSITKLESLFKIEKDVLSAEKLLEKNILNSK